MNRPDHLPGPDFEDALNDLAQAAHDYLPDGVPHVVWDAGFIADDVLSSWLLDDQEVPVEMETRARSHLNDLTRRLRAASRDQWTTIRMTVTRDGQVNTAFGYAPVSVS